MYIVSTVLFLPVQLQHSPPVKSKMSEDRAESEYEVKDLHPFTSAESLWFRFNTEEKKNRTDFKVRDARLPSNKRPKKIH